MNWENYLPDQQAFNELASSVSPEIIERLINPQKVWGGPVTPAEQQESDIARLARYYRDQQAPAKSEALESDPHTAFDLPIDPLSWAKWGSKAALAGLPLAAGMAKLPTSRDILKAALDELGQGSGGHVPIWELRDKLGWPRDALDNLLKYLGGGRDPLLHMGPRDPRDMTPEQIKSLLDFNGTPIGTILWRGK